MAACYLARIDEARRLEEERDRYASQFHQNQREVGAPRATSVRYSQSVAWVRADCDRYRAECKELRAARTVPSGLRPMSQEVRLPVVVPYPAIRALTGSLILWLREEPWPFLGASWVMVVTAPFRCPPLARSGRLPNGTPSTVRRGRSRPISRGRRGRRPLTLFFLVVVGPLVSQYNKRTPPVACATAVIRPYLSLSPLRCSLTKSQGAVRECVRPVLCVVPSSQFVAF